MHAHRRARTRLLHRPRGTAANNGAELLLAWRRGWTPLGEATPTPPRTPRHTCQRVAPGCG
eukprot:10711600-Lingulodinium_polyedra.AAC.1